MFYCAPNDKLKKKLITLENTVYILLRSIIVYLKQKTYYLGNYCSYFISGNNNRFWTKR